MPSDGVDALAAVIADPARLQRPILELGDRAIVARPPELVLTLLEEERLAKAREMLEPSPINKPMIATTIVVFGAYVAYAYLVEIPAYKAEEAAKPAEPHLGAGEAKVLPDGRILMEDGSIRAAGTR